MEFILEMAIATRNAQNEIAATWLWPGKTVAQWDADLAAIEAAQERRHDSRHCADELQPAATAGPTTACTAAGEPVDSSEEKEQARR